MRVLLFIIIYGWNFAPLEVFPDYQIQTIVIARIFPGFHYYWSKTWWHRLAKPILCKKFTVSKERHHDKSM